MACKAVKKLKANSRIFPEGDPNFSYLDCDDLVIGEELGVGGFSEVHQATLTQEPGTCYAVKFLKRNVMVNQRHFKLGASDLALEAHFLQALSHKHIVKLRGVTAGSVENNVASGKECGFFIVIDRLYDTLEERIQQWKEANDENEQRKILRFIETNEYKVKRTELLMERLQVALDICSAMQYLHGLDIVFRDLKPENIGFDDRGVVKLFDFGLAKELRPENRNRIHGTYQLTGKTGSRRYMAPEVANERPYNKSVDVYSFGILLWEICSMEKPFFGYSQFRHQKDVVVGNERPRMDSSHTSWWPEDLQVLVKQCWSEHMSWRPNFEQVIESLESILSNTPSDASPVDSSYIQPATQRQNRSGERKVVPFMFPPSKKSAQRRSKWRGFLSRK